MPANSQNTSPTPVSTTETPGRQAVTDSPDGFEILGKRGEGQEPTEPPGPKADRGLSEIEKPPA